MSSQNTLLIHTLQGGPWILRVTPPAHNCLETISTVSAAAIQNTAKPADVARNEEWWGSWRSFCFLVEAASYASRLSPTPCSFCLPRKHPEFCSRTAPPIRSSSGSGAFLPLMLINTHTLPVLPSTASLKSYTPLHASTSSVAFRLFYLLDSYWVVGSCGPDHSLPCFLWLPSFFPPNV